MAAIEITDDLDVYDRLCEHAHVAVEDADDLLAVHGPVDGDVFAVPRTRRVAAAARLVEASELYRLAAHALDPDVTPSARG